MRRTESLRSFTDRPGYGEQCAVCSFCGKINDASKPETQCHHLVQWNQAEHDTLLTGATFTDSPRQEKLEKAQKQQAQKQQAQENAQENPNGEPQQ